MGRPIPRAKPMQEMGVSGTPVWGGFVQQKEKSSDWTGHSKWTTISEIAVNVSVVAASVHHFLNLIARPEWNVMPADEEDPQAVEHAEFVEDVLHDMSMPLARVVRKSATYKFYGFGIQEWTAKRRPDGLIGFESLETRPQHTIERWEISESGAIEGAWQRSPQTGDLLGLPRTKIVYLVEDTLTDSPEGLGLFRHLAEPYNRFKKYLELEARAFERDLRGIPIGRVPITLINEAVEDGTLKKEEALKMIKEMEDFVQLQVKESNTGMVLDSQPYESTAADGPKITGTMQWGLELLQGSANGLAELNTAIDRLQREMARIIGTEHLMMGDQGGNRALATDKSRNLYLIANSVLEYIVQTYQQDLVNPLWALNGFPEETKPTLGAEHVAFKDVQEITAALRDMASAGAVLAPDDPVINDVREILGVSRVELSDQMMGVQEDKPEEEPDDLEEAVEEDDGPDQEDDETFERRKKVHRVELKKRPQKRVRLKVR